MSQTTVPPHKCYLCEGECYCPTPKECEGCGCDDIDYYEEDIDGDYPDDDDDFDEDDDLDW